MWTRGRDTPVAVRLVATYGLIVAATLLVVAGLAYDLTRRQLARDFDTQLQATVGSFERAALQNLESPEDLFGRAKHWLEEQALPPGRIVAVRSDGRVLSTPGPLDLRTQPGGPALLRSAESGFSNLEAGGTPIRALTVPLRVDGRSAGTLVVAGATSDVHRGMSALLFAIWWATGVGVAMATLLGLAAIRRTLRPLKRISKSVETIQTTGDLSRRVGGTGPMDEVGRLAVAFDRMLAKLEDGFRSQQRFLSDASHELRTPITVARGRLELLQEATPAGRETVAPVVEELDRIGRIVENLLLLARLDEGMALSIERVEVELILREALLRGMVTGPSEATVDADPGLYVFADSERLLQVLTTLVRNAVQHAGEGARLSLVAHGRGTEVDLFVTDTGTGIPAEDLPHVFERFYRGSTARHHTPTGAGLGLAISASLVEAMNGSISVESKPGKGTTFTISLPRAEQVSTATSSSASER